MLRRRVSVSVAASAAAAVAGSLRFLTVTPIPMPALSPTMEKGKISEWLKTVGDPIASGDTWCKVETDKAVVTYENVAEEGFIARIIIEAGQEAAVGDTVCLLVDEKEGITSDEVKQWKPSSNTQASGSAVPESDTAPAPSSQTEPSPTATGSTSSQNASSGGRVKASPLAKMTAAKLGVPLEKVTGTGGGVGRIVRRDVEAAAASGVKGTFAAPAKGVSTQGEKIAPAKAQTQTQAQAPAPQVPPTKLGGTPPVNNFYVDIPVTNMRSTIAKRLTQSKNIDIPHYYLYDDCCADNMMAVVKQLNAKGRGEYKITINDYIIKAVARANLLVPACNSSWQGSIIRQYNTVDVSVAVATPEGLITPIIKNAHAKGLVQISQEMKALAKKAREGTLQPDEFIGGTVSVSNLGASGIPRFSAIINPPQSTILAVGTTKPRPKIVKNAETGEFEMTGGVETAVSFTASFDHRVVDGATGAEWFKHFHDAFENPLSLLL